MTLTAPVGCSQLPNLVKLFATRCQHELLLAVRKAKTSTASTLTNFLSL
jgi:hypothetical protein